MEFEVFHHPDLSLPVIRRRAGEEFLMMLMGVGEMLATRGRSLTWNHSYPNQVAYDLAVRRLRKQGVIAYRRTGGREPVLRLTEQGVRRLPEACRPERYWKQKWHRIWYVLTYDVPEPQRAYRRALQGFLEKMRMGWLHRSVWVSPRDIRPQFDDLVRGAAVSDYAFLFEARTVLGQSPMEVVRQAWDIERLEETQRRYCKVFAANLDLVRDGEFSPDDLLRLAREEMRAYLSAFALDPLLPRELWPAGYRGPEVYKLHRALTKAIADRL